MTEQIYECPECGCEVEFLEEGLCFDCWKALREDLEESSVAASDGAE